MKIRERILWRFQRKWYGEYHGDTKENTRREENTTKLANIMEISKKDTIIAWKRILRKSQRQYHEYYIDCKENTTVILNGIPWKSQVGTKRLLRRSQRNYYNNLTANTVKRTRKFRPEYYEPNIMEIPNEILQRS